MFNSTKQKQFDNLNSIDCKIEKLISLYETSFQAQIIKFISYLFEVEKNKSAF